MKAQWLKYAARIDALSQRERIAVFGAVIAVIVYLAFMLFLDPVQMRRKALDAGVAQQRAEIQAIQTQIAALESKRVDPDAANMARRNDVQSQIAEIDVSLKDMHRNLVPAEKMKALLQDMLSHQPRLQVLALRTLPVTPLVDKPAKAEKGDASAAGAVPAPRSVAGDDNVFKHGVEITLQGSYADLYDYLARVEKLPWRMFWSRASLNAEDYPRLKLTVTIYTLSLDKAWLVV
jgi:MSHA biogenesis protein MshJ